MTDITVPVTPARLGVHTKLAEALVGQQLMAKARVSESLLGQQLAAKARVSEMFSAQQVAAKAKWAEIFAGQQLMAKARVSESLLGQQLAAKARVSEMLAGQPLHVRLFAETLAGQIRAASIAQPTNLVGDPGTSTLLGDEDATSIELVEVLEAAESVQPADLAQAMAYRAFVEWFICFVVFACLVYFHLEEANRTNTDLLNGNRAQLLYDFGTTLTWSANAKVLTELALRRLLD